jgi:RNA polymerase primary sigma factor
VTDINRSDCRKAVDDVLKELSSREEKILRLYFGLDGKHEMTLREIGDTLGLTNERVRQIKEFALKKMRTYNKSSKLREFLSYKL